MSHQQRHWFWGVLLFLIFLYGAWAAWLSWTTIQAQSTVRNNLTLALGTIALQEQQWLPLAGSTLRAELEKSWDQHRALWVGAGPELDSLAKKFLAHWNQEGVPSGCGPATLPFQMGPAPGQAAQRACHVYVYAKQGMIMVTGFDTQGAPMDNFYESLYPFRLVHQSSPGKVTHLIHSDS